MRDSRTPLVQVLPLEAIWPVELLYRLQEQQPDARTRRKIARRLRAVERLLGGNGFSIDAVQLHDAEGGRHALALRSDWRETR
jgi:hypothetical protein